jgi:hypothetical protein
MRILNILISCIKERYKDGEYLYVKSIIVNKSSHYKLYKMEEERNNEIWYEYEYNFQNDKNKRLNIECLKDLVKRICSFGEIPD